MQYKYAKEQVDYSDFSSGRVFYSLPGHPAFPVRLASEIFQRCISYRETIHGASTSCTLYDPCCGAAYHLSVLGYLHGDHIQTVIASDVDEKAIGLAKRNLGLLSREGLEQRISEISDVLEKYGKDSHMEALQSASMLKEKVSTLTEKHPPTTQVFLANATNRQEVLNYIKPKSVDIVFTDVPYGRHSHWHAPDAGQLSDPLTSMLDVLHEVVSPSGIVAIVSDKQQKVHYPAFQRLEQFPAGKRRVTILKPG